MDTGSRQHRIKVFVVGDSTLAAFQDDYFLPRFGYGTQLGRFFRSEIEIVNLALSGRSSKSFLSEPEYQTLKTTLGPGDFLIIGFGHNDEKPDLLRYTDPSGNPEDPDSFSHFLITHYLDLARKAGAIPILCTPIVRRNPEGRYSGTFVHVTRGEKPFSGGDYPQVIRNLGTSLGITVLDMTEATRTWHERVGTSKTLELHARLTEDPATVDNSHLNQFGAWVTAYLFAKLLSQSENPLKQHLKPGLLAPKKPSKVPSQIEKRFPGGLTKAFNFTYDDGVLQDERFVEMLDRHGLIGTFNLNSGLMSTGFTWVHESGMTVRRLTPEQAVRIYRNHEVAAHSLTHPYLTKIPEDQVMNEMIEDKRNLERWFSRPVEGFGYPFDEHSPLTVRCSRKAGFAYARISVLTGNYGHEKDPFRWKASIFHLDPRMEEFVDGFLATQKELAILQIVGHTYEFDVFGMWDRMETLCARISSHPEIWKTSTLALVNYLKAMDHVRIEGNRIVNSSGSELWFAHRGKVLSVSPNSVFVVK